MTVKHKTFSQIGQDKWVVEQLNRKRNAKVREFVVPELGYVASPRQLLAENRMSSAPYVSGDTFRSYCDHAIDEVCQSFHRDKMTPGDTIFLNANYLPYFCKEVHSRIQVPYILVTHNSVNGAPGPYGGFLNDRRLVAWFAQNTGLDSHPKLFSIPVGIANAYWPHGDIHTVERAARHAQGKRDILVYVNFDSKTNLEARVPVERYFAGAAFAHRCDRKPFSGYLHDLARSKFVVCPPGKGLDCHRTWEALYMGSIPIVQRSPIGGLYEGLPVVVVDDWRVVTEGFLESLFEVMGRKTYKKERVYVQYWCDRIDAVKEEVRQENNVAGKGKMPEVFAVDFDESMGRGGVYSRKEADLHNGWVLARGRYGDFLRQHEYADFSRIPKILHHIRLGTPMPRREQKLAATWKRMHPQWQHMLWTEKEIDAFNLINRDAYSRARNYGEKSDIARYEILCRMGGVYVDTDFECLKPLDVFSHCCEFFAGAAFESKRFSAFNGLIGSVPGHPILKRCIEGVPGQSVSENSLANTGPYLFGECIEKELPMTKSSSVLFPVTYFYPWPHYLRHDRTPSEIARWIRPETHAVHHWHVSWQE